MSDGTADYKYDRYTESFLFSQKIMQCDIQQIVIPIHMGHHGTLIVRRQSTVSISGRIIDL